MNTKEKLRADVIVAQKAQNMSLVVTLRSLINAIQLREKELLRELTEIEVIGVLEKQAKQRKESMNAYYDAGQKDRYELEFDEYQIIMKLLPQQMDTDSLEDLIDESIAVIQSRQDAPLSMKDMGRVVSEVKKSIVAGTADMGEVSRIIKSKLS
jgi:uncharacterized protein YqeY